MYRQHLHDCWPADYRANVKFKGAAQEYKLVVAEVWHKYGGQWKLVHYQETEIK